MSDNGNMTEGDGSEENAFRHALWLARMTHEFDPITSTQLANADEGIGPFEKVNIDFSKKHVNKPGLSDSIVDLLNNEIGRNIASGLSENASAKDIASAVLKVQLKEGLWTVTQDKKGNISIIRSKITQEQFRRANKKLGTLDNNGMNDSDRKQIENEQ